MKCMHCLVEFHDDEQLTIIGKDGDGQWALTRYDCPACNRMNLFLVSGEIIPRGPMGGLALISRDIIYPIRPKGMARQPAPDNVPKEIGEDYREACLVLSDSPKASAALSRRCLQGILRDTGKVKPSSLENEIQQVLDGGQLPSYLIEIIDAVRNIGNFAAHPSKSKNTGEIISVQPGEAEWNLDVIEALFDFYYVQPEIISKKRETLNAKLQEAGRNPMK